MSKQQKCYYICEMRKKIIGSSIQNLTDARYFAGWLVDYLHFDLRPESTNCISLDRTKEFLSWVEGPVSMVSADQSQDVEKLLVDTNSLGYMDIHQYRMDIASQDWTYGSYLSQEELMAYMELDQNTVFVVSEIFDVRLLKKFVEQKAIKCYIDLAYSDWREPIFEEAWVEGFMVHGSPEEKVGYKSFDELDEIFEWLEELSYNT